VARDCERCDAEGIAHAPDCAELYAREHGGHVPCACGPCAACEGRGWVLGQAPEDPRQLALPGAPMERVPVDRCGECWVVRPVVAWRLSLNVPNPPRRPVCEACLPAAAARVRRAAFGHIDPSLLDRLAREEARAS
jgi:hypothetical protein